MDDYYGNEPDDQQDSVAKDDDKGGEELTSAVLHKSILAGKHFDVGEEVVLKITGMSDDEITVEYATGEGGSKDSGETGSESEPAPEEASHY